MLLVDRIYGKQEIQEKVLVELIMSQPLQRLKGIAQYGVPDPYYHLDNYSRYEHSVGVLLLLRKLEASLEEQVAGLLHDVSHTAFSHVVDWVLGDGKTEDFQDEQHEKIIERSEIPGILKKYGLTTKKIADYHRFGLLERDAPDVCADRLDYALREIPEKRALALVRRLRVKENKIVFEDKASALSFGREYLKLQMEHWGGFEAASRYRLFANILRGAMERKIISMADFWQDDEYIIKKVLGSGDSDLVKQLKILEQKSLAYLTKSDKVIYKKFRYVDPLFSDGDRLTRASEVDEGFKQEIEVARKKNEEGVRIARMVVY